MKESQETECEVQEKFVPLTNGSKLKSPPNSPTYAPNGGQRSVRSKSVSSTNMAGDIRGMDQKKPRKTWSTVGSIPTKIAGIMSKRKDRSVLSVHLLKANLAEDGCEEAQLDVAKKLLEDSDDITTSESSQRMIILF
ncbi:unnamed protein product [Allacma fusca]|uniref:Uncharacterized protein n=1 Tax=Allacma fusca TaxID=39272 RepID=A0A8J2NNL8_9HEXA|nr:unnamed protein product [Allacma fusca]